MSEFIYLIPEFFLLFSIILVIFSKSKELLSFFSLSIASYITFEYYGYFDSVAFNGLFVFGRLTQSMKIVVLLLGSIVALMCYVMKGTNSQGSKLGNDFVANQGISMMMVSIFGALFLISSNHFLSLYVALELFSLPMYIMAASDRSSVASSEAGVKYFVLGSLASCILVYGISILYVSAGKLAFDELPSVLSMQHNLGVIVALVMIVSGLLFKIAVAPFHLWIADVYSGSPKKFVAFFSVIPKIAIVVLLCRLFDTNLIYNFSLASFDYSDFSSGRIWFKFFFLVLGILSVFVGSIAAVMQSNIRRLFAYSTINHMGYIIIAIAVSKCSYGLQCLYSAPIAYLIFYSILNIGLFSFVLMLPNDEITCLAGLSKKSVILPLCFSLILLSSAGIPPFAGFFMKFYIVSELINDGFSLIAFVLLLSTAFSVYYYLKLIKLMYFDEVAQELQIKKSAVLIVLMILVSAINTLFFMNFTSYLKII